MSGTKKKWYTPTIFLWLFLGSIAYGDADKELETALTSAEPFAGRASLERVRCEPEFEPLSGSFEGYLATETRNSQPGVGYRYQVTFPKNYCFENVQKAHLQFGEKFIVGRMNFMVKREKSQTEGFEIGLVVVGKDRYGSFFFRTIDPANGLEQRVVTLADLANPATLIASHLTNFYVQPIENGLGGMSSEGRQLGPSRHSDLDDLEEERNNAHERQCDRCHHYPSHPPKGVRGKNKCRCSCHPPSRQRH